MGNSSLPLRSFAEDDTRITGPDQGDMTMKVIATDTRLTFKRHHSPDVLDIAVSGETPLGEFVTRFLSAHSSHGTFSKMKIYCHGYVSEILSERVGEPTSSLGGFGLQFCREGITLETVGQLSPICGKVQEISVPACRAAHTGSGTTADGREVHGDGLELMRRLAITTGARVRASINTQFGGVDPHDGVFRAGEWEGSVLTFDENGMRSPLIERHPLGDHP